MKRHNDSLCGFRTRVLCLTGLALLGGCDPGPVDVDRIGVISTVGGEARLLAARTAGDAAGEPDGMFLRYHVRLANPASTDLVLNNTQVGVRVDGVDAYAPYVLDSADEDEDGEIDDAVIEAGEHEVYKFEHVSDDAPFDGAGFNFSYLNEGAGTLLAWAVEEHRNETASGGYNFPARLEDLHPTEFWRQGRHSHATGQAYALDLSVRRWRDGGLTTYTEQAFEDDANGIERGSRNEHFLAWGKPVYAMHDATILKCRRLRPDNTPGEKQAAANVISVDHGNGEFAAYAHFMQESIPPELCPTETYDDDVLDPPVSIHKGQFLGLVGNSGRSSSPHLHLVVADAPYYEQRYSLPINFGDVAVHGTAGFDFDDEDLNQVTWADPRAMGLNQLLLPNTLGWPQADLPLGALFSGRDGTFCATREAGQDRVRVEFQPGDAIDVRSGCTVAAEAEVEVHSNWTLDIDAHERSGVGRTLFLRSWDAQVTNKRNLALEWVKLRDGSDYVYQVSLKRIDAGTSETWTLEGSGHLLISIGKNSMSFAYGNDTATASIGFVGVGSTKSAKLYTWKSDDPNL